MVMLTLVLVIGTMGSTFAHNNPPPPPQPPVSIAVVASPPEGGNVSGGGNYWFGQHVNLLATANPGYEFVNWSWWPNQSSTNSSLSFDAFFSNTFTANFRVLNYNLSIAVNDPEMGSYVSNMEGAVPFNSPIEIDALAAPGYRVLSWTVNSDSPLPTSTEHNFSMPANDVSILITFEPIPYYDVTTMVDPEGTGTTTGDGSYQVGDLVELTATPAEHFSFDYWDLGEFDLSPTPGLNEGDISFVMPEVSVEATAMFVEDPYVWATPYYVDNADADVQPPGEKIKVYLDEPYSIPHPASIGSYLFAYTLNNNDTGTISSESEAGDFDVIFHYYLPAVITNTVTETVVVTVPVTTEAPTEAVTEEVVPLGEAVVPFNFDSFYDNMEMSTEEVVAEEETPLADALPQTGQMPVELFYGVGGMLTAIGAYIKRKK